MAFNGFLPAVQKAQRKGQVAKDDPLGQAAYDASAELALALQDRDLQRAADRHAGGDRELLHKMWMSGELMAIYEREAIATLRRCGKHDLADDYERALADAPLPTLSTTSAKDCEASACSEQSSPTRSSLCLRSRGASLRRRTCHEPYSRVTAPDAASLIAKPLARFSDALACRTAAERPGRLSNSFERVSPKRLLGQRMTAT